VMSVFANLKLLSPSRLQERLLTEEVAEPGTLSSTLQRVSVVGRELLGELRPTGVPDSAQFGTYEPALLLQSLRLAHLGLAAARLASRVAESAEKQDHEQDDDDPSPEWNAAPPSVRLRCGPLTTPRTSWSNA
jgi:hypothetical protein